MLKFRSITIFLLICLNANAFWKKKPERPAVRLHKPSMSPTNSTSRIRMNKLPRTKVQSCNAFFNSKGLSYIPFDEFLIKATPEDIQLLYDLLRFLLKSKEDVEFSIIALELKHLTPVKGAINPASIAPLQNKYKKLPNDKKLLLDMLLIQILSK